MGQLMGAPKEFSSALFFAQEGETPEQKQIRQKQPRLRIKCDVRGRAREHFLESITKGKETVSLTYLGWDCSLFFNNDQFQGGSSDIIIVASTQNSKDTFPREKSSPTKITVLFNDLDLPEIREFGPDHEEIKSWDFTFAKENEEAKEALLHLIIKRACENTQISAGITQAMKSGSFLALLVFLYHNPSFLLSQDLLFQSIVSGLDKETTFDLIDIGAPLNPKNIEQLGEVTRFALQNLPRGEKLLNECISRNSGIPSYLLPTFLTSFDQVKLLLSLGASPKGKQFNQSFSTLLFSGLSIIPTVNLLITCGFGDFNEVDEYGFSILEKAARVGSIELCEIFISHGAKPDLLALSSAIASENLDLVKTLLRASGPSICINQLLFQSSLRSNLNVFRYLLEQGGDPLFIHRTENKSVLEVATEAMRKYVDLKPTFLIFMLLKKGLIDRSSWFVSFPREVVQIILDQLLDMTIPFVQNFGVERAAKIGWVRYLDKEIGKPLSLILQNTRIEEAQTEDLGASFVTLTQNGHRLRSFYSVSGTLGFDVCFIFSFQVDENPVGTVSIGWREEDWSCKGGGTPGDFRVTGVKECWEVIGPLLGIGEEIDPILDESIRNAFLFAIVSVFWPGLQRRPQFLDTHLIFNALVAAKLSAFNPELETYCPLWLSSAAKRWNQEEQYPSTV